MRDRFPEKVTRVAGSSKMTGLGEDFGMHASQLVPCQFT
jgi:hypothetical protein